MSSPMQPWQKDALRRNTVCLVADMDHLSDLVDKLFQEGLLSDHSREAILEEKLQPDQVRKLLDHIRRRPSDDFDKFLSALCDTHNGHLADSIQPGFLHAYRFKHSVSANTWSGPHYVDSQAGGGSDIGRAGQGVGPLNEKAYREVEELGEGGGSVLESGENYEGSRVSVHFTSASEVKSAGSLLSDRNPTYCYPKVWPDESRISGDIKVCNVRSSHMLNRWKEQTNGDLSEEDYDITTSPRGRAILISNERFHNHDYDRPGNQNDENRLVELLDKLAFDLEVWKDKTEEELLQQLDDEARIGVDTFSCFLMIILTHGQKGKFMTADNKYMDFEKIMELFDSSYSARFAGKPKMFFVQACQGSDKDNGCMPQRVAEVTERFTGITLEDTDASSRDITKTAKFADMFVAVATVPGFVSWRNLTFGTWFIQAIIEIFANRACDEDVNAMFPMVNNLVSRGRSQKGHVQISYVSHNSLRGKVFLFPGLGRS